jgi:GT2 family glycosyltransferase
LDDIAQAAQAALLDLTAGTDGNAADLASMTHPSISVALCTHNGAKFLREQLRSIFLQTRAPEEIVMSDDASQDDSVAAARSAAAEFGARLPAPPRLHMIENAAPLGVSGNFEQAALACQGDLIALSDQDDVWRPDRLARAAAEFDARPDLLLLHSDARLVDAAGASLGRSLFHALEVKRSELEEIHSGAAFDALLRRNLATGATIAFRRALLRYAAPFPAAWVHDEWLAITAAAVGRVDVLEEPLIDYRQHAANQIGARRETLMAKLRKAVEPRGAKYRERAAKAEILLARLCEFPAEVAPETVDKMRGKLAHQRFRADLPGARLARCAPVLREALSGRYGRFGRGGAYIVQDLLESGTVNGE